MVTTSVTCSAEGCEGRAVNFCTGGCDFICHQCIGDHNKDGITKYHKVISVSEGRELIKGNEHLEGGVCSTGNYGDVAGNFGIGNLGLEVHQHQPLHEQQQPYQQIEQQPPQQQILMLCQRPIIRRIIIFITASIAAILIFIFILKGLHVSLPEEMLSPDGQTEAYSDQIARNVSSLV